MSSINGFGSGYYQLSNLTNNSSGNTTQPNTTDALIQALNNSANQTSSSSSSSDNAFLLDLSPQAQQYLSGAGNVSTTGSFFQGSNFTLTPKDQQTITNILTKYKDAPQTQDTFNQIQNDLSAAGLDPNVLSMKDKAQSFNPAQVLLDALNGTTSDASVLNGTSDTDESTKSSNYMQQIISQWKSIAGVGNAQNADAVSAVGTNLEA